MRVSVIGLGKLGLCTAACFASRGHDVFGMDTNRQTIEALQSRQCPIDETGLEDLLQTAWDKLTFSDSAEDAVMNSDITLIIVPTPSKPEGDFSNDYVEAVLRSIAPLIGWKKEFHVVDVVSTVMPGSCDNRFRPLIEKLADKRCGSGFGLVYNPEFIALGSVVRNFLNPDMVLIGASDQHSAELTEELYRSTCQNNPCIAKMSLINAEITKISLNCYVTTKISFANQLAAICERIPGANIDDITFAMGADKRIGNRYLQGGLGFGGPCFPRDNIAFQRFADEIGFPTTLGNQVVLINNSVVDRIVSTVTESIAAGGRIALLGMSYKPETHIIEESQSVMIAERLASAGYQCVVYDPQAIESTRSVLGGTVDYSSDPYEAIAGADAILLLTNWPQLAKLDWSRIAESSQKNALLVDSWRILNGTDTSAFNYRGIGIGADPDSVPHEIEFETAALEEK